jgi:hypothetical protein
MLSLYLRQLLRGEFRLGGERQRVAQKERKRQLICWNGRRVLVGTRFRGIAKVNDLMVGAQGLEPWTR